MASGAASPSGTAQCCSAHVHSKWQEAAALCLSAVALGCVLPWGDFCQGVPHLAAKGVGLPTAEPPREGAGARTELLPQTHVSPK